MSTPLISSILLFNWVFFVVNGKRFKLKCRGAAAVPFVTLAVAAQTSVPSSSSVQQ